jgi:hypothetical protein
MFQKASAGFYLGHNTAGEASVKESIGEFLDVCCGIILCSISSNTCFPFSVVIDGTGKESIKDVDGGVDGKGSDDGSGVQSSGHESTGSANGHASYADDAGQTTSKKGSDDDGHVVGRGSDGE